MAITIISPQDYKIIPWKNGLGETTELAINTGGCLSSFDWRLSIATVAEDGVFSDFSGYARHLVLISGRGIHLEHRHNNKIDKVDQLDNVLDMASFDGANKTFGRLTSGLIKDFNIMTKNGLYQAIVKRYIEHQTIVLAIKKQYFVYGLKGDTQITFNNKAITLPMGHLLNVAQTNADEIILEGSSLIVIQLSHN